jgi:hypothetical protein
MGFTRDLQRMTSVRSITDGLSTGMRNISSGLGSSISNIMTPSIRAMGQVTDIGTSMISSPIMYVGAGIVGLVLITTVMGGSKVADTAMRNPDSIREIGKNAQSFR